MRWALLCLLMACGADPAVRAAREARDAEYAAAERAYGEGRWAEADALFAALAEHEADADQRMLYLYRRASIARRRGDAEAAKALFDQVVGGDSRERSALATWRQAMDRFEAGDPGGRAALRAVVAGWPDSVAADKAVKALADRPGPDTLAWLGEVAATWPEAAVADNAIWRAAQVRLHHLGDLRGARLLLRQLVERWPFGPLTDDALWMLGQIYARQGLWTEAVGVLEALVALRNETSLLVGSYRSPYLDDAALAVADIRYHALEDPQGAAAAYRAFVEAFPTSVLHDDALWGLAQAHLARGDAAAAQAAAARLRRTHPGSRYAEAALAVVAGTAQPRPPDPEAVAPGPLGGSR